MVLRTRISDALKQAMKDKAADRLSTLRLINAAIKDKDIAARADEGDMGVGDAEVLAILGKMAKQRMESVRAYEEGGRLDLADREREEIAVIEEFLPRQLTEEETAKAVDAAIAEVGATSIRDMGKVIGLLKGKYTGQMDQRTVQLVIKGDPFFFAQEGPDFDLAAHAAQGHVMGYGAVFFIFRHDGPMPVALPFLDLSARGAMG